MIIFTTFNYEQDAHSNLEAALNAVNTELTKYKLDTIDANTLSTTFEYSGKKYYTFKVFYKLTDELKLRRLRDTVRKNENNAVFKVVYTKMREIDTDSFGFKTNDIIESIRGQLSDGIWEHTSANIKYWTNFESAIYNGKVYILVSPEEYNFAFGKKNINPFYSMADTDVKKYLARKLKQIVKIELTDKGLITKDTKPGFDKTDTYDDIDLDYVSRVKTRRITVSDTKNFINFMTR